MDQIKDVLLILRLGEQRRPAEASIDADSDDSLEYVWEDVESLSLEE